MQEHVCPCPWLARSFSSSFANVSAGRKAGRWTDPRPSPLLTNPSSSEETPRPLNEPSSHWRRPRGCKLHPVLHQHPTKKEGFRGNCRRDARGPGPRHRQLRTPKNPRRCQKNPGNTKTPPPGNAKKRLGDAKKKVNKHLQVHKSHPGRMGLPYRAI